MFILCSFSWTSSAPDIMPFTTIQFLLVYLFWNSLTSHWELWKDLKVFNLKLEWKNIRTWIQFWSLFLRNYCYLFSISPGASALSLYLQKCIFSHLLLLLLHFPAMFKVETLNYIAPLPCYVSTIPPAL